MRITFHGISFDVLTNNSMVPDKGFDLLAGRSCPGRSCVNDVDYVCSDCYAMQNCYSHRNYVRSTLGRTLWTEQAVADGKFAPTLIKAFRACTSSPGFIRVHGGGDFFSPEYAIAWREVCSALSDRRFWFPTRTYRFPKILEAVRKLAELPNVTVRPSAMQINDKPPKVPGLDAGTTVIRHDNKGRNVCPLQWDDKGENGNTCMLAGCTRCWEQKRATVAYVLHGRPRNYDRLLLGQPTAIDADMTRRRGYLWQFWPKSLPRPALFDWSDSPAGKRWSKTAVRRSQRHKPTKPRTEMELTKDPFGLDES